MVRRNGIAVHGIRHYGHLHHGPGPAGGVGRFGIEGYHEGRTVVLPRMLPRNHDARVRRRPRRRRHRLRTTRLLSTL